MKRIVVTLTAQDDIVLNLLEILKGYKDRQEIQAIDIKVKDLPFFPPSIRQPIESFAEASTHTEKTLWYQRDGFSKAVASRLAFRYSLSELLTGDLIKIQTRRGIGPNIAAAVAQWREWRESEST